MKFLDIGSRKDVFADGKHDDTKAIQKYLDEMQDGGTIYFPDGTYLISAALIFYSNQWLKFSDNAVLLRSDKSESITKYMLAAYSEPEWGEYDGTHDVVISGGIFDGNEKLTEKLTILNTVHSKNITVKNCRFTNGALWHYIEFNSTDDALILDCIFDGSAYTAMRNDLTSELVQVDAPEEGTYGPVYNCDGKLIDFKRDRISCRNIKFASNIFKCNGFTAIGHHGVSPHNNIEIICNVFEGTSGNKERSRGYITFMEETCNVTVSENAFISKAEKSTQNIGILTKNPDKNSLIAENNIFIGYFSEYFSGEITNKNNTFEKGL